MKSDKFSFDFLTCSIWGVMALTVLSGIFLAVYYVPTFSQAFSSLRGINEQIPFGWMFRRLHAAGGSFLLLLLLLHLLRVFYAGAYKTRPGWVWMMEALLVIFTLWTNFTGSFLPLSQEAFWGTAASLSSLSTIPRVGNFLVEFIRGGRELGGAALERFFSMHIGFAALTALFLFRHSRRGIPESGQEGKHLLNLNLGTGAAVAGLLFAVVTLTPYWFADPLKGAVNPAVNPEVISSPWYFLFLQETLSFFNTAYPVFSVCLWAGALLLLFSLPYIDRNPEKKFLRRPLSLSVGSALAVVLVYFTFLGLVNAHYGDRVILPEDPLSPALILGAQVFSQRNCAYCHQVFGREGRREGPDMAVVVQRGRTKEWLQRFILNPQLYQPGTTMSRYDIPLQDLEDLSTYLLSLNPQKRKFQTVDRALLLGYEPFMGPLGRK
jgi:quinol-cytochrome oxidoreductase complex cytochrome b subunit/cytochrome c2